MLLNLCNYYVGSVETLHTLVENFKVAWYPVAIKFVAQFQQLTHLHVRKFKLIHAFKVMAK